MRPYIVSASFVALVMLPVACSVEQTADQGDQDVTARVAKKGSEFIRCWTKSDGTADEFFRRYELSCRVSSSGLPGLAGTTVYVDARGARGNVVSGTPGDSKDRIVSLGSFSKDAFPLELSVYGSLSGDPTSGEARGEHLTYYRVAVSALESATEAAPVIVKIPFDTWPVTILNRAPLGVVDTRPYEVQAAPFITEQDSRSTKTTFQANASTGFMRGSMRVDLNLIAPPTGGLRVSVQGPNPASESTIAGPGVYVLETTGLRVATAAEVAAADGVPLSPAADGGVPSRPDASAPSPDGGSQADAGTCGAAGQSPCVNNFGSKFCNAGTRLEGNTCLACGNAGQTYCVNNFGSKFCNAGLTLDAASTCR
jgi:hypothetical protein